jgi:hypothetical protein
MTEKRKRSQEMLLFADLETAEARPTGSGD